jgi:hypothetical protein
MNSAFFARHVAVAIGIMFVVAVGVYFVIRILAVAL